MASKPEVRVERLVVDTNALIKRIRVDNLADALYTIPEVQDEVRDEATRNLVDNMMPTAMIIRQPSDEAMKHVRFQARRTGDLRSLSLPDLKLMALTWQLHCEAEGTSVSGAQADSEEPSAEAVEPEPETSGGPPKQVSSATFKTGAWGSGRSGGAGAQPTPTFAAPEPEPSAAPIVNIAMFADEDAMFADAESSDEDGEAAVPAAASPADMFPTLQPTEVPVPSAELSKMNARIQKVAEAEAEAAAMAEKAAAAVAAAQLKEARAAAVEAAAAAEAEAEAAAAAEVEALAFGGGDEDDDGEGEWITPKNIAKVRSKERAKGTQPIKEEDRPKVACITGDFAMQNVMMRMGLKVMATNGMMIKKVKQFVNKCNACFNVDHAMASSFCSKCGSDFVVKVSMTVDKKGRVFFSKGARSATSLRGTKFSIPASTTASTKKQPEKRVFREDELFMGAAAQARRIHAAKNAEAGTIFELEHHADPRLAKIGDTQIIINGQFGNRNPNVSGGRKG
jgi:RNA-binding protein NOB1